MSATPKQLFSRCKYCRAWINLAFGADSPAEHAGAKGSRTDPRSPGDWDDICDVCAYDGPPDDPDGPWSGGFAENH